MSPAMIRCLLKLAGLSISDIARSLPSANRGEGHLAAPTVGAVIDGRARSKRIEAHIATALAMPLSHLWPQWYAPDGSPIKKRKRYVRAADALARLRELQANAAASNREAA